MRLGISSFAFGWAVQHGRPPFDEQDLVAFARRHGAGIVQLGDNLPVHRMPEARLEALLEEARQHGIELELGARGLTAGHLETYLRLCRRYRAPLLRFVTDEEGHEPAVVDLIALLRDAVPALGDAGVLLAIENHDRLGAATLRHIMETVDSSTVGICLDTANSLGAGEGLGYVVEMLAPFTINLHVKDVVIRRLPHQMGFVVEGRPLGEGQLPIRWALDRVREAGRCRSAILEAWTPPSGELEDTLRRERASAESSMEALKRMLGADGPRAS